MQYPDRGDLDNIHRSALRVLKDIGFKVENRALLDALAGIGAEILPAQQIARFPHAVVDGFLEACPSIDHNTRNQSLTVRASLYAGQYLDPHTDEPGDLSREHVEGYLRLAHLLPCVNATFITGCPWGPSPDLEPLYERFFCWKFGAAPSGILYPHAQAARLLELYEAYAQLKGKAVADVFCGGVFIQSPLRFSAEEAGQFEWWWSRGFNVETAHMTTAGLTAPVTPAGVVTMHLAEAIASGLLRFACYGERRLDLTAMMAPVDMRVMKRPYGSPEMAIANRLFAAMARYYSAPCFLHSGVSDARHPSFESGAQKTMSTLSALLTGADAMIDAGLLGGDTLFSPIQMILDNELASALQAFLRPTDCSEDAIGFDAMLEAGPGGLFTGLQHTVDRFREELWEPSVWSREARAIDSTAVGETDAERALSVYDTITHESPALNLLTPEEERVLRKEIEQ